MCHIELNGKQHRHHDSEILKSDYDPILFSIFSSSIPTLFAASVT